MRSSFVCFLLAAVALLQVAGAKKKPEVIVRFFPQVLESNGKSFAVEVPLVSGQGTIWISKVATVSEKDILAFFPFQNADGSIGAYFKLDDHGTLLLDTLSVEQRGQYLVAVVNGRHVIDLVIDKRIPDGIAVIPKGLLPEELDLLRQKFPIIGETPSKKR